MFYEVLEMCKRTDPGNLSGDALWSGAALMAARARAAQIKGSREISAVGTPLYHCGPYRTRKLSFVKLSSCSEELTDMYRF